jgi:hypothetical protein
LAGISFRPMRQNKQSFSLTVASFISAARIPAPAKSCAN